MVSISDLRQKRKLEAGVNRGEFIGIVRCIVAGKAGERELARLDELTASGPLTLDEAEGAATALHRLAAVDEAVQKLPDYVNAAEASQAAADAFVNETAWLVADARSAMKARASISVREAVERQDAIDRIPTDRRKRHEELVEAARVARITRDRAQKLADEAAALRVAYAEFLAEGAAPEQAEPKRRGRAAVAK